MRGPKAKAASEEYWMKREALSEMSIQVDGKQDEEVPTARDANA